MPRPALDNRREAWSRDEQYHFENRITSELGKFEDRMQRQVNELSRKVDQLNTRVQLMIGAVLLMAFVLPLVAPFVREAVGIGS